MSISQAISNAQQKVAAAYTAISNKGGTLPATQDLANMPNAVSSITELKGETKTVTPTTSQQTITPSSGKNGITQVTVNAVTSAIDSNIQAGNIKKDVSILGVTGTYEGSGGGGSETRKLTIKLINTMTTEGVGHCSNGGIFPQTFAINNTTITLNDCIENGFTYSMYVPDAIYSLQNLYCITYQGEFSKDASIDVVIYDSEGMLNQVETNNGVVQIDHSSYANQLTLSEDTIIKLFWGFDPGDIDIGDGGDIIF